VEDLRQEGAAPLEVVAVVEDHQEEDLHLPELPLELLEPPM
jgi:hypothetical protein